MFSDIVNPMSRLKPGTRVTITDALNVAPSQRKRFVLGETTGTVTKQVRPSGVSGSCGYECWVEWNDAGSWGATVTKCHQESELSPLDGPA